MACKPFRYREISGVGVFIAIVVIVTTGKADTGDLVDAGVTDQAVVAWLDHVRECQRGIFSLKASFVQELRRRHGPEEKPDTGVVKVRRGGRVRLRYDKPTRRLVVSDGKTLWAYDPSSKTVIESSAGSSLMPRLFSYFLGDESEDGFVARHIGGATRPEEGTSVLELVPRKRDTIIAKVVLSLKKECPCVQRVLAVDHTGAVIRVTLDKIRTNVGLGRDLFTFKPPPGTKIVKP